MMFMSRKRRQQASGLPSLGGWYVHIRENAVFDGLWEYHITSPGRGRMYFGGNYYATYAQAVTAAYAAAGQWAARDAIANHSAPHDVTRWSILASTTTTPKTLTATK